ncbi:MAG: pirin family protein [Alphaproteobacteria bacterium]|nr:pirin family protein [Alphaproteobacteria bacterium]
MSQAAEKPITTAKSRGIARVVSGMPTQDGAGVKLTRLIGTPQLGNVDPFLMLDAFGTDNPKDYIAGFPEHPHRGFETMTYMIQGTMQHRDNHGGEGLITDGGVQWMTAGRGVAHSEMPAQTGGRMFGFQLWINLPAKEKMRAPWYADIPASAIPSFGVEGAAVKLIAGEWNGRKGPAPERVTAPFIADVTLAANASTQVPLPEGHAGFVYVFEGAQTVGGTIVNAGNIGVLSDGGPFSVNANTHGARLLVVAGKPLREPIAKYGPFVMNTADEIRQAIHDYQSGKF